MSYITVRPAYGRTYKNQAAIKADWEANKDFICADFMDAGRSISKSCATGHTINVRYDNDRKVCVIKN